MRGLGSPRGKTEEKTMNEPDDDCVGFNLSTQMLHCLIVLDDRVAQVLSVNAGNAYYRAFIVEDRKTGEIQARQRFRYKDGDSWSHINLTPDKQRLGTKERVKFLVDGIRFVLVTGTGLFAGGLQVPEGVVTCFYPPESSDAEKTFDWLIAQDLIEIKAIGMPDGRMVEVSEGSDRVM